MLDLKSLPARPSVRQVVVAALAALCGSALVWVALRRGGAGAERFVLADEEVVIDTASASKPDLDRYMYRHELSELDLGLTTPSHRLILIGDIHGSLPSLRSLLHTVSYDPERDTLFHLGDILAKGPDSEAVVQWMAERAVKGVRGNHDQKVVGWRAWMDWVERLRGGKAWLKKVAELSDKDYTSLLALPPKHKSKSHSSSANKLLSKLHLSSSDLALLQNLSPPSEWEWSSEHFHIARSLSSSQAAYLSSLPLLVHVPDLSAYFVHAGLLPQLRKQTKPDAWTLMNMRSVLASGAASRKWDGRKWIEVWDEWASSLSASDEAEKEEVQPSVVYGHAASAGLVITPHTVGIDTGCVYGRKLTAIVVEGGEDGFVRPDEAEEEGKSEWVRVGRRWGRLVSVECDKEKA